MDYKHKGLGLLTAICLIMATVRAGQLSIEPSLLYCVLALVFTLIFANSELNG